MSLGRFLVILGSNIGGNVVNVFFLFSQLFIFVWIVHIKNTYNRFIYQVIHLGGRDLYTYVAGV